MISAFDLSSRDVGSASDPYLIVKMEQKVYNERKNYQINEASPNFHKYYDFEGIIPGVATLSIDVMDYDDIFGDDLIGATVIDLEDRFFNINWQTLDEKPVEYR